MVDLPLPNFLFNAVGQEVGVVVVDFFEQVGRVVFHEVHLYEGGIEGLWVDQVDPGETVASDEEGDVSFFRIGLRGLWRVSVA